MKMIEPRGPVAADDDASQLEQSDDPDPLSARAAGTLSPPKSHAPASLSPKATSAAPRGHDPYRIRGEALRRSLYFTMIAWLPGAFWQGATNGAPLVELAKHLGSTDFVYALLIAAPDAVLSRMHHAARSERRASFRELARAASAAESYDE